MNLHKKITKLTITNSIDYNLNTKGPKDPPFLQIS